MRKKLTSAILILTLLIQIGCYSLREITLEKALRDNEIDEVNVTTKDSLRYIFEKPDFTIVADTIKGKAGIISQSQVGLPYERFIPLSDVIIFETDELDETNTIIFIGASILVVGGIFLLLLAGGGICHNCNF